METARFSAHLGINTNKANDAKAMKALKKDGWKIITVWECRLKPAKAEKALNKLLAKFTHA